MNNRQLQEAIDSARNFIALTGTPSGPLWEARSKSKISLAELEKIQVQRAAMANTPRITLGDIK
jgi:hypothetical protein